MQYRLVFDCSRKSAMATRHDLNSTCFADFQGFGFQFKIFFCGFLGGTGWAWVCGLGCPRVCMSRCGVCLYGQAGSDVHLAALAHFACPYTSVYLAINIASTIAVRLPAHPSWWPALPSSQHRGVAVVGSGRAWYLPPSTVVSSSIYVSITVATHEMALVRGRHGMPCCPWGGGVRIPPLASILHAYHTAG